MDNKTPEEVYAEMQKPFDGPLEAQQTIEAFFTEINSLREKYGITEFAYAVSVNVSDMDSHAPMWASGSCGNAGIAVQMHLEAAQKGCVQVAREYEKKLDDTKKCAFGGQE